MLHPIWLVQESRDSRGRSTGDGSCSHTYTFQRSWSDSSQSYGLWAAVRSESAQGTTETRPLNSFSVFLCFLFFLETTGYRTLSVDLVVSLRLYLRLSYKLGTDHFCVEIMLWSPCAFTIYSNYMHTHRLNLTCCSEPPCFSGVSSEFSSVHDSLWCSCCSNLSLKLDLLRSNLLVLRRWRDTNFLRTIIKASSAKIHYGQMLICNMFF